MRGLGEESIALEVVTVKLVVSTGWPLEIGIEISPNPLELDSGKSLMGTWSEVETSKAIIT